MTKIFISYARNDGRDLALKLQADLSSNFGIWLDTSEIGGGDSWSREIEEAINTCEVFLALMSAGSFTSEICRGEQLRALRLKKRVIPLLVQSEADRPIYLEGANYQDFSDLAKYHDALTKLKEEIQTGKAFELKADFQHTRVHITESLPSIFVPRPIELEALRKIVLSDATDRQIALTAIKGMGGIGKSVLAIALCQDEIVQAAFPDGIVWVKIGRENVDLTDKMKAIGTAFGDVIANYQSFDTARVSLANLLANKSALIVLDDVWEAEHLKPFLINAPRCRTLFTTRNGEIALAMGASQYNLGMLHPDQALKLLEEWAGRTDEQFPHIAERLGYLPLALQLVGAQFRRGVTSQEWLTSFEKVSQIKLGRRSQQPEENLKVCLDLSVNRLPEDDRPLYHSLGVFPEDIWIPETAVSRLWIGVQPNLNPSDCTDVLQELEALSLIERNTTDKTISMHDLLHSYNREMLGEQLIPTHEALLKAYNPEAKPWYEISHDGYLYFQLAYHLIQAGRKPKLIQLLVGLPDWMQQKYIACVGDTSLVQDLELAWADYADPLTPQQVLDLVQLRTVRQVVNARVNAYDDTMLKALVYLGRTKEAFSHARLRSVYREQVNGLLAIFDALYSRGQTNLTLLTEIHSTALKTESVVSRASALVAIAVSMVQAGDEKVASIFTQALDVAGEIEDGWSHVLVLTRIVEQMAKVGDERATSTLTQALKVTGRIEEAKYRANALSGVAEQMAKVSDERASDTFTQALGIAGEIENTWYREGVLNGVAEQMAKVGQFEAALRLADGIEGTVHHEGALSGIAKQMAQVGQFESALRLAGGFNSAWYRATALRDIAVLMAKAGQFEQALGVAGEIEDPIYYANALGGIAEQMAKVENEQAASTLTQALRVASGIEDVTSRVWVLSGIAEQMAKMSDERADNIFKQTLREAGGIEDAWRRADVLSEIAEQMAKVGQFEQALRLAGRQESAEDYARALNRIAIMMAQTSNERANNMFAQTLKIAKGIEDAENRANVLSRVSVSMAQIGQFEQALRLARGIEDAENRASALSGIAEQMAQTSDERVSNTFTQALGVAGEIKDVWRREGALSGITEQMAKVGQFEAALEVASGLGDAGYRVRALSGIAKQMVIVGQFEAALEVASGFKDAWRRADVSREVVEQMAQVGQFESAVGVANRLEDDWYRASALSGIAEQMAKVGNEQSDSMFAQALRLADGLEDSAHRIGVLKEVAEHMAKAGQVAKAIQTLPLENEIVNYLQHLVTWQPAFEQIETGLSLKVLREATRIVSWVKPAWSEIHTILANEPPTDGQLPI